MNWFPDMVWLFLEWWVWPLLGMLLGLAIGWLVWRRGWRNSETEVLGLRSSIAATGERNDAMAIELSRLKRESWVSEELALDLDLTSERAASLEAERDDALSRLASHEQKLQAVIDLRTDLEKGLVEKETEVVNLRAEHESSVQSLQGAQHELEALKRQSSVLEVDVDGAKRRVTDIEATLDERETQLSSLQGLVADRDTELVSLRSTLSERDARLGEVDSQIAAGAMRTAELEGAVAESQSEVVELRSLVGERDGRVLDLEAAVAQREQRLTGLDAWVVELQGLLGARDGRVGELEAVVAERDHWLGEREGRVVELENLVVERDQWLGERDRRVAELEGLVGERDGRVLDLEAAVAQREQRLTGLDAWVVELQGLLGARDGRVVELEALIAQRDGLLSDLESQVEAARGDAELRETQRGEAEARVLAFEQQRVAVQAAPTAAGEEVDAFVAQLQSLSADRELGYVDDLQEISGVGPVMENMLNGQGLNTFYQLALLDESGVEALERRVESFPGRIIRDEWVPQAADLHFDHHGEDLRNRVVIERSGLRSELEASGNADFFVASLVSSKAERPGSVADDLKPVKGIGKKMSDMLNENGLTTLYQLARLDHAAIDDLEGRANLQPGRIRRENWVPQAAQLHFEVHGEEIYDLVTVEGEYSDAFEAQLAQASMGRKLDYVDELQMISGVGPKMESLLHDNGLRTFLQVSLLDGDGVAALNDRLDFFPGRIERDEWVGQAARLHAENHPAVE